MGKYHLEITGISFGLVLSYFWISFMISITPASVSAGDDDTIVVMRGDVWVDDVAAMIHPGVADDVWVDDVATSPRPILRIDECGWKFIRSIDSLTDEYRILYDTTYVDTTRYYAKVDTVGWRVVLCGDTLDCGGMDLALDSIKALFGAGVPCKSKWRPTLLPTIDTTWHPKVQVWLTPTQLEKLMEVVE